MYLQPSCFTGFEGQWLPQDFGSSSTCEDTSINTGMEVNYCTTLCQRGIRVTEMRVGSTTVSIQLTL